jgi:hypothetical protein
MKGWFILLVLGVVALLAGGAMVVLGYHHTIGLGVVGLGSVLVIAGLAISTRRRTSKVQDAKAPLSIQQKGERRKILLAVGVVLIVGVGSFYGAYYLISAQPGSTSSSISISTTSSGSLTTSTSTGQTVSSSPSVSVTSASSTSRSSSTNATFRVEGFRVAVSGNNATLTANYVNIGTTSMTVNVHLSVAYSNGTVDISGLLVYPAGQLVAPNNALQVNDTIGPFLTPGLYILSFYVQQDGTGFQLSLTTAITFRIS